MAPLLAALVLGSLLVQASPNFPVVSMRIEAAYAERVESLERLAVTATELGVLPAQTDPRPGSARATLPCAPATCLIEMSASMPLVVSPAGAAVGNYTYTVSVRERYPAAAPAGARYSIDLLLDGSHVGNAELAQVVAEPVALEGARVVFDVGRYPPLSPQFVVLVRSIEPAKGEFTLRAVTSEQLQNVWKGEGGTIHGATNPPLTGTAGDSMRIKIRHDDASGAPHNLQVKSASGVVVAGPTSDITADSPSAQLDWTPIEPGRYRYECRYHLSTQFGTIDIT